jgi:hypothetical protein
MTDKSKEHIFSKSIIEFLTVANEYCLFTEKAEMYSQEDIALYYLKICPLLYLKGILLPEVEGDESEITERYLTEENYEIIFQALRKKFGETDTYWCIDDEGKEENATKKSSISEQIADVYQDMKDFVMLYQKNTQAARENAVAECRRLFETHWGTAIVNMQQALHKIIFGEHGSGISEGETTEEL